MATTAASASDLSIYWLDSRRPSYLFPPVKGGFARGVGTF
jgi:hypothetical protein